MKIVRYSIDGEETFGFTDGEWIIPKDDVEKVLRTKLGESVEEFLLIEPNIKKIEDVIKEKRFNVKVHLSRVDKIEAPLKSPEKIICLGLNYHDHANEAGLEPPDEPIIFTKTNNSLIGPYENIVVPSITKKVDYEAELAFVVGKRCKRIDEDEALNYIFGYIAFNDVSARDLQFKDRQWVRGKSLDTFAPIGPWIVTSNEIDPNKLKLTAKVNGEVMQDSSTSNMIFKVPFILAWLSKGITLQAGDIISTGTPSGVGVFKKPPYFLKEGDIVEITVDKIGSLRNKVVFEKG
jgi:2-keto-4-pentenoate hydratase/2-oxohepta-3-ene-1,7-dioic acid hydratase in catechol pathway